jgi:hypothetical protein
MKFWVIAAAVAIASSGAAAKSYKRHDDGRQRIVALAESSRDPNGSWTIEATTSVGNCPALIPTALTIADNKVASADGASVSAWGYVDEDRNIVARFTGADGHVARFHGIIKAGKGSGAWSSSTDMCGGAWRGAQK